MITLSSIPSQISLQRLRKSGRAKDMMKAAPRSSPSQTRAQFTSIEATGEGEIDPPPIPSDQRSQARLIRGGFLHGRAEAGVERGHATASSSSSTLRIVACQSSSP